MKSWFFIAASICIWAISVRAEATIGETYRISFEDVDGNALSIRDSRNTIVVLTSKGNVDKASAVGDRIPDFCLGNPNYRMVTVISFERGHSAPVRAILK